jgi:UV DNA damage endonuclease
MRLRHLGYACQNVHLGTKSRTVRLANLTTEKVIPVIVQNLDDIEAALRWNVERGISFFRISSDLIPFATLDQFPFDWEEAFKWKFDDIRRLVKQHDLRVSSHPGQYTVLNSNKEKVVAESVKELDLQARVLRLIDPKQGTMTLHVGGAYGDKPAAMDRFAENLPRLSDEARNMLTIENDDRTFTLKEVVGLAERTELPVIVDLFHHRLNYAGQDEGAHWRDGLHDLLERSMALWGKRVPKLHLSSGRPGGTTAHADYIEMNDMQDLLDVMAPVGKEDAPFDLMLEAKRKEEAVLEVRAFLEDGTLPDRDGAMRVPGREPLVLLETTEEAEG